MVHSYCALCGGPLKRPRWDPQRESNDAGEILYDPEVLSGPYDPKLNWLSSVKEFYRNPLKPLGTGRLNLVGTLYNASAPVDVRRASTPDADGVVFRNLYPNGPLYSLRPPPSSKSVWGIPVHSRCIELFCRYMGIAFSELNKLCFLNALKRYGMDTFRGTRLDVDYQDIAPAMGHQWRINRGQEYFVFDPVDVIGLDALWQSLPNPEEATITVRRTFDTSGDPFAKLSPEILHIIMEGLDVPMIYKLRQASAVFANVALHNTFWKSHIKHDMPWLWDFPHVAVAQIGTIDWEETYRGLSRAHGPRGLNGLRNRKRIWEQMLPLFDHEYRANLSRVEEFNETDPPILTETSMGPTTHVMMPAPTYTLPVTEMLVEYTSQVPDADLSLGFDWSDEGCLIGIRVLRNGEADRFNRERKPPNLARTDTVRIPRDDWLLGFIFASRATDAGRKSGPCTDGGDFNHSTGGGESSTYTADVRGESSRATGSGNSSHATDYGESSTYTADVRGEASRATGSGNPSHATGGGESSTYTADVRGESSRATGSGNSSHATDNGESSTYTADVRGEFSRAAGSGNPSCVIGDRRCSCATNVSGSSRATDDDDDDDDDEDDDDDDEYSGTDDSEVSSSATDESANYSFASSDTDGDENAAARVQVTREPQSRKTVGVSVLYGKNPAVHLGNFDGDKFVLHASPNYFIAGFEFRLSRDDTLCSVSLIERLRDSLVVCRGFAPRPEEESVPHSGEGSVLHLEEESASLSKKESDAARGDRAWNRVKPLQPTRHDSSGISTLWRNELPRTDVQLSGYYYSSQMRKNGAVTRMGVYPAPVGPVRILRFGTSEAELADITSISIAQNISGIMVNYGNRARRWIGPMFRHMRSLQIDGQGGERITKVIIGANRSETLLRVETNRANFIETSDAGHGPSYGPHNILLSMIPERTLAEGNDDRSTPYGIYAAWIGNALNGIGLVGSAPAGHRAKPLAKP